MIEVSHLTKRYGNHYAVHDLSFSVEKGRIYGFLGPNGAGKSTTMNIITGCLSATDGTVTIDGHDIFEEPKEAKRLIGFLPELPPVYLECTVEEYLKFVADAKKVARKEIMAEVERVMEKTKITHFRNRLIKNLSKGYRQRVGIAQALISNPPIIILDEPTVGLDPQQIIEIRELITSLKDEHTVILSSHILSEVQAVCQDILIIAHGKMVACDTTENLEKQFTGRLTVHLSVEGHKKEIKEVLSGIKEVAEATCRDRSDGMIDVDIATNSDDETELCRKLFFAFSKAEMPLIQMKTNRANLEDIFITLTRQADEEAEREAIEKEED